MPENTPFFDIIQLKRTPTNQLIHHLAVQCGEYHVEPLSKALSHLLKGNGGALYLPRLLLGNLSPAQMSKYFTVHDNYMKSLRTVTLAPMIENLDSDREEFFENGEVVVRSTRAWALSLTLPSTGLNARCDIVNGGYAQVATLLVPRHNYESILPEVVKYKQRLNPVDQREARFRKTILGLPGVIHIDPSVQEALDTLEMMSSENVWKRAPPAVRQGGTITDNRKPVPSQATASVTSNLSQSSDSESDPEIPPKNRKKKTPRRKNQKAAKNPQEDASMTPSVASIAFSCKDEAYQDLERQLKSVLAQRNQDFKTTQSQLLDIDTKLKQLDPRLDNLEAKAVQSMQYHLDTNNALTAVQSQMSQMMEMMQNITRPTQHQNGLNHERALPSSPLAVITEHPVDCAAIIGVFPKQDTQYEGNRSVASSSSGSQHEKPPPKKTLKRSMPDAVEDPMHLDSCNIEDDASSSSFGSTPPIYPVPEPIPPPPFQLEMEHPTLSPHGSEMETDDTTTLHNLAMPDLEDQYTLSDAQESGDTTSPDGGTNG
ncbi:hypothetical protein MHU86_22413 [Fragilaria crotonensis]|nr:hypothetical protein MHU86_22413 [Fragilaria crotonensis]